MGGTNRNLSYSGSRFGYRFGSHVSQIGSS